MSKIPPNSASVYENIKKLASDLRDKNGGCPWDIEQTHASLRPHLIEESYETLDAIDEIINLENEDAMADASLPEISHVAKKESILNFKEELGDLVFQVVMHSQLAEEKNWFNLDDVLQSLTDKLVFRHPHVYGDETADNSAKVLKNWEALKARENQKKANRRTSILDGVPNHLPALATAQKLGAKAAKVKFDWPADIAGAKTLRAKILEEWHELLQELPEDPAQFKSASLPGEMLARKERAEEELGDLLFVLSQTARMYDLDAETALRKSSAKFRSRFTKMEKMFAERLNNGDYPSLAEWEDAWQAAKQNSSVTD
ncbi:MAG: MazG family protein [Leptospiraceae bacterium]|nr:MazG family protein [Leptospiraceae bacterium]